jgi:hypothetical protein
VGIVSDEPFPVIPFLEGKIGSEDNQPCPGCGLSYCVCFDDDDPWVDHDVDDFDCHMGPDGQCGAAGSEMCDFECPTMRAYRDGSLP